MHSERAQRLGPLLFSATLLLSAFLLFAVQPLFARMALPLLGGSPGVWNTALLFFQSLLLAAYAAVHGLAARLGPRRQVGLHLVALLLPILMLPIALPPEAAPPAEGDPTLWLLALMATVVGLPYFAVACSSPLLQRWFASSGHPASGDPYFLFAASNLGSLAGLLAYPLLVEPRWSLEDQARGWTLGYGILVLLLIGCAAWTLAWGQGRPSASGPSTGADAAGPTAAPPLSRRLWWAAMAALPSSLMIGATTAISTDLASFPLLWLPPLGLYLLSFVLVFARRRLLPARWVARALPMVALPLVVAGIFPQFIATVAGIADTIPPNVGNPPSAVAGVSVWLTLALPLVLGMALARIRPRFWQYLGGWPDRITRLAGLEWLSRNRPGTEVILGCSADIPTITGRVVDEFVETCRPWDKGVYYNFVPRERLEERFPNSRRTYSRYGDMEAAGGDMVIARIDVALRNRPLLEAVTTARKLSLIHI